MAAKRSDMKKLSRKRESHPAKRSWVVADIFRHRHIDWVPTNAGYELRRMIKALNRTWIAVLKVHVLPENGTPAGRQQRVRFKSSVTLWPPSSQAV
jgi:hypothetical protein